MPVNRNALIRYKTIDNCLQNRYRKWTLDDLIEACSEALYEYEGIDKGISKRSIQMDIQMMRSDKLGYNAPIIVLEKKYYTYEDPDYSITNIPLTGQDLNKLTEVVELLKQFSGFSHFQELSGMVQRLEDKIHSSKTNKSSVIDFEKNENLKGLQYLDSLYQAIINETPLNILYKSFKSRTANTLSFHPYLLKEYRNRWFVLGITKRGQPMLNLALDRIEELSHSNITYIKYKQEDIKDYFKDVIGVSVNPNGEPENVMLFVDQTNAPYVITKPLHHSQQLIESTDNGIIISLKVQLNFELEKEILGFGDAIRVIKPENLKRRIRERLAHAVDLYDADLTSSGIKLALQKAEGRGSSILQNVYTKKEVNKIKAIIQEYFNKTIPKENKQVYAIRQALIELPELKPFLFNKNLKKILASKGDNLFLSKAIYFDKPPESNWYVTWHQDITINVNKKIETEGYTGWTQKGNVISVCPPEDILKNTLTIRIHLDDTDERNGGLKIIPGSHQKKLNDDQIAIITQNSLPLPCDVKAGGIHFMKPLLLHASSKGTNQKHRRVLHLEFNSIELPGDMEWGEKVVSIKL